MMTYVEEGETLKDKTRCARIRADLKLCMLETDCCRIYKKTPRQCLRMKHESVPQECYSFLNAFYECKRSLIDGRRRFRGPKE